VLFRSVEGQRLKAGGNRVLAGHNAPASSRATR
jgi:hypothetical protein